MAILDSYLPKVVYSVG